MMNEKLRRYGATLSTITALGGAVVASAEAQSSRIERGNTVHVAENNLPPSVPKGAYTTNHFSLAEVRKAQANLNKRWDGVFVLHAPKKNVYVGFTQSPSYYVSENPDLYMTGNKSTVEVICSRPGIEKIHGRDYAVVYDMKTNNWAFLDIRYAEESGALSTYAFRGKKARIENYSMEQQEIDGPVIEEVTNYGADWHYSSQNRPDKLLGIWLPTNTDPDRKYYHLSPTNVVPNL